jgi:hypothetical protein
MIEFNFEATLSPELENEFLAINDDCEILDEDDNGLICFGVIEGKDDLANFNSFFEKHKLMLDTIYFHRIHVEAFKLLHPIETAGDEDEMAITIANENDYDQFIKIVA